MLTYLELIELIEGEKTGIAKGYSVCHLRKEVRSVEYFESLMKRDLKMFEEIQTGLLNTSEPHDGEWVEYEDGEFARIASLHGSQFQLSNKIGVNVWERGSQASGCTWDYELDHIEQSRLMIENLIPTNNTKKGLCWTFSEKNAGGDRGVYFEIDCKVWKLKK
jgi:hypothetical protein